MTTRLTARCSRAEVWTFGPRAGAPAYCSEGKKAIGSSLKRRACRSRREKFGSWKRDWERRCSIAALWVSKLTDTGKLMLEEARAASPFLSLAAASAPAIAITRCRYERGHPRMLDKRSSAAISWVGQNDVRLHKDL